MRGSKRVDFRDCWLVIGNPGTLQKCHVGTRPSPPAEVLSIASGHSGRRRRPGCDLWHERHCPRFLRAHLPRYFVISGFGFTLYLVWPAVQSRETEHTSSMQNREAVRSVLIDFALGGSPPLKAETSQNRCEQKKSYKKIHQQRSTRSQGITHMLRGSKQDVTAPQTR